MEKIHILLLFIVVSLFADVKYVDVSNPNSVGEVTCQLGDTITFSNGVTVGIRSVEDLKTEGDLYTSRIYLAVLEDDVCVTYHNEQYPPVDTWYTDSLYELIPVEAIPYLDIEANGNNCSEWDTLTFPSLIAIDSFLILDTVDNKLKLDRAVPGHFIGIQYDYWMVSIVENVYPTSYGDMVYVQKKDKSSAIRFRLKELDSDVQEDGYYVYGTYIDIRWEVDSLGNGFFKGDPTGVAEEKQSISTIVETQTMQLLSLSGAIIVRDIEIANLTDITTSLPKGVYLLKSLQRVRKLVVK